MPGVTKISMGPKCPLSQSRFFLLSGDMFHCIHVSCLAILILTCPLRCMSVADAANETSGDSACPCCPRSALPSDDDSQPEHDGCGDCLCNGAVLLQDDWALNQTELHCQPLLDNYSSDRQSAHMEYLHTIGVTPTFQANLLMGRATRIAHASLLL